MITIVDPVSTGRELSASFAERGTVPLHLYQRHCEQAYADDPHPHTLLVDDPREALGDLAAHGVTAVVAGSEWGVDAANDLSHALGLPHHVDATAAARRDKAEMNRVLHAAGVPAARTERMTHLDQVDRALGGFTRFPVIVKPLDSAGGDGCMVCHTPAEVEAAVAAGLGTRNLLGAVNRAMLLQDHLEGPQFIVNTVSMSGRHVLSDLHAVRVDRVAGRPVMRDSMLLTQLGPEHEALVAYVGDCLDALGVREGAAHSEVRITADGPRLVEVNARIMGASLDPSLYRPVLGYSHADLTAERFADPAAFALRFTDPYRPTGSLAMVMLHAPEAGIVTGRPGLAAIKALPGFHRVELIPEIGDVVTEPWLCTGRAGMAYLRHRDEAVVRRSLDRLHQMEDRGGLYSLDTTHHGAPVDERDHAA